MSKKLSDTIMNRAKGLVPFPEQPIRKGGTGAPVWHGLGGTQRHGIPLPTGGKIGSRGPAPGRDVYRAKGMPGPGNQEKVQDKPSDRKLKGRV